MSGFAGSYPLSPGMAQNFSPAALGQIQDVFKVFDADGSGFIDQSELTGALSRVGETVTEAEAAQHLREMDQNSDGKVNFEEFVTYVFSLRTGSSGEEGHRKIAMRKTVTSLTEVVQGHGGSTHVILDEEKIAFSEHINHCLADDPHASRHLPLDVNSRDLFERCNDGLIFCKLINLAVPDTIDERALNKKDTLNVYQKTENNNLAVNAAKSIGCQVVNIGAQDLIEGRPVLILGLLWQIIKIQLTAQISLKNYPELVLLLREGEEMSALSALPPEDILLRWFNYHLERGGSPRRVTNFGDDLKDSECYSVLLHQLDASKCDLCQESDLFDKAGHVIRNAVNLGAYPFLRAEDICSANKKLNLGFVALLFNTCHGLEISEEVISNFDFASLNLDDAGDSREERVFRMWINSLNMPGVYIHDLFDDLGDGFIILQLEDSVQPGVVNWKRTNKDPKTVFKKVENCNYAVEIGRTMGFSMVNIGGLDIVHKDKKLILAIIWQLMRRHTLKVLAELAVHEGLTEVTEDHIINWANARVAGAGRSSSMKNFKDVTLKTGAFLLDLLHAVEPRAINWELVTPGSIEEDQLSNAKYCISTAQKVGACVFLTPEDIVEVKSKMIMTFVSSIWATDLSMKAGGAK